MEKIAEICGLLTEQKEELEKYEAETALLLTCDIDDIETHVAARERLLAGLATLEGALRTACEQDALYQTAKNKCDRALLPADKAAIFDAGEQAILVAVRIRVADTRAADRIGKERGDLVETIKEYNRSADMQVTKYYDTARLETESGATQFGKA